MIELPRTHPDFDIEMEVLCSVPPYPNRVSADDLAYDLGIEPSALPAVIKRINSRPRTKGMLSANLSLDLRVKKALWPRCKALCEAYWNNVYRQAEQYQ